VFFTALAWLNVRSITWWEGGTEGRMRPFAPAVLLAACGVVIALLMSGSHPRAALILLCGAGSSMLLAALDRWPLEGTTRRAAADFVLLTPLLCLLSGGMVR